MGKDRDISFLVAYPCPHCQSPLEGRAGQNAWLRCPKCGKPSRPPAHAVSHRPPEPVRPGEDVLVLGPAPEPTPMTPVAVAVPGPRSEAAPPPQFLSPADLAAPGAAAPDADAPVSAWRVALSAALFVSVTLLLFAYLDRSLLGTSVFSALALFCFVALALPARGGRSPRVPRFSR